MKEKICCFAGNDCYIEDNVRENLSKIIEKLIVEESFNVFYYSWHGSFDEVSMQICYNLKKKHPNIKIVKVFTCARFGGCKYEGENDAWQDIIVFDFEDVYPKSRITYRNKRMVETCDVLVCYIKYTYHSGAYKMVRYARKLGKRVIEIEENV